MFRQSSFTGTSGAGVLAQVISETGEWRSHPCRVPLIRQVVAVSPPMQKRALIKLVLVAFIDESYPQQMTKYCVSAVVLDMVSLFNLGDEFRSVSSYVAGAHNIPVGTELHAHPLMQGRKGWQALAGKHRAQTQVYIRVLKAIVDSGAKVFIEGLDVEAQKARYSNPFPPHRVTLSHVLERVNDYAAARGEEVLVVADEVPEQEEHAASMALYSLIGTPGYRSSTLPQILQPVRFDDSCFHHGLQAADFVAYLYNRLISVTETSEAAEKAKARMWEALLPAVNHVRLWTP